MWNCIAEEWRKGKVEKIGRWKTKWKCLAAVPVRAQNGMDKGYSGAYGAEWIESKSL